MAIPNLDVFQVIADPSRRQILQMLTKDNLNINRISESFEMSRPAVSKHIKILETAGFVTIQIVGREHYCLLNEAGFEEIRNWVDHFDRFWNTKLRNLDKVLSRKKSIN